MGKFRITVEYLPERLESVKYTARSEITEEAYTQNNDVLEYAARDLVRMFKFDYEIEKENVRYKPPVEAYIPINNGLHKFSQTEGAPRYA